jgi:hypothetical protein
MLELDRTGDEVDVVMGAATGDPSDVAMEAAPGNLGIGMGEASLRERGCEKVERKEPKV